MITAEQIRAARALLRWSAQDLADRSGIGFRTIQRFESESGIPGSRSKNLMTIRKVFENAGVAFIDQNGGGPGVRLKEPLPE
jgi:transcriptional regulator with XRE-family HTH domain